jgi:hypothetical protein
VAADRIIGTVARLPLSKNIKAYLATVALLGGFETTCSLNQVFDMASGPGDFFRSPWPTAWATL